MARHRIYLSPSLQQHNPYVTGGVESTHMREVGNLTRELLNETGRYVVRMSPVAWQNLSDSDYLGRVVGDSNTWTADLHIALHSNAGGAGAAGTDTYYAAGSAAGKRLATLIQRRVGPVSPGKDHGLHTADFYELLHTHAPAALVEVAFHTDPKDAKSIAATPGLYAMAIAEAVCDYYSEVLKPAGDPLAVPLKKAALAYAKAHKIVIPDGFNASSPGLGTPARMLFRRIADKQ